MPIICTVICISPVSVATKTYKIHYEIRLGIVLSTKCANITQVQLWPNLMSGKIRTIRRNILGRTMFTGTFRILIGNLHRQPTAPQTDQWGRTTFSSCAICWLSLHGFPIVLCIISLRYGRLMMHFSFRLSTVGGYSRDGGVPLVWMTAIGLKNFWSFMSQFMDFILDSVSFVVKYTFFRL